MAQGPDQPCEPTSKTRRSPLVWAYPPLVGALIAWGAWSEVRIRQLTQKLREEAEMRTMFRQLSDLREVANLASRLEKIEQSLNRVYERLPDVPPNH